ncbi:hypothetical protein QVG61_07675 [Thiohalobacter sp. IOR34]|uniref:hypothetical protein n=1 Tax=Thiohalobacter sp. IOR34 TaxID=3057176 RepID=UPI0025B105F9|nr:hypothetical protein [Thiohalobacter sp. IOR34]WJW74396.1 hypothetical protein QVG61_07675 [Thiohalobacter sp. IOR34]
MFRKFFMAGLIFIAGSSLAMAEVYLKPFTLGYTTSGELEAVVEEVKGKLQAAGFEIAGDYTPYAGAAVIAVSNDSLKKAAASSEFGGYGAAMRVAVTKIGDEIEVSYTNPVYWANAYRLNDLSDAEQVKAALQQALGRQQDFGTGDKQLTAEDLREYHYMFGMEYFDDPSELAEYDSYEEAVAAVEQGLAEGRGGVRKVYRIDIPGKQETVFGVALTADNCSGDEYIMSRIDKDRPRSTAHLPYEMLVSGDEVYALYARFRIAISWPHLPMLQSETGATFFNIMCAPNAIEEALIEAAGGED